MNALFDAVRGSKIEVAVMLTAFMVCAAARL